MLIPMTTVGGLLCSHTFLLNSSQESTTATPLNRVCVEASEKLYAVKQQKIREKGWTKLLLS